MLQTSELTFQSLCHNYIIIQISDGGIREAVLAALKGVVKHAGKSVSGAVRLRACSLVRDMLQLDDDEVRSSAAKVMGIISQVQLSTIVCMFVCLGLLSELHGNYPTLNCIGYFNHY